MKILKFGVGFFLISIYCQLDACELSNGLLIRSVSSLKRFVPSFFRSHSIYSSWPYSTVRICSTFNGQNNEKYFGGRNSVALHNSLSGQDKQSLLERLDSLSEGLQHIVQNIRHTLENSKTDQNTFVVDSINKEPKYSKSDRKIDIIRPLKLEDKDLLNLEKNFSPPSGGKFLESRDQEEVGPYQNLSKTLIKMRGEFISKIIGSARTSHPINEEDVKIILDLYAGLVNRPKEGITRVLNGQTNTGKSTTFKDVLAYIQSKESSLDTYRALYASLCKTFGEEAIGVIFQVAEKMKKERKILISENLKYKNRRDMSLQDYISLIMESTDPLYPVKPDEVLKILDLYGSLHDKPRDKITRVLNYQTNTGKSTTYSLVVDYICQNNSDLETYRNIYGRLYTAGSMGTIYQILDNEIHIVQTEGIGLTNRKSQGELASSSDEPAIIFKSNDYTLNKPKNKMPRNDKEQEYIEILKEKPTLVPFQSVKQPLLFEQNMPIVQQMVNPKLSSEPFLETKDGKYRIYKKEQERLNKIYDLLPEYHGNSITGVLSGSTGSPLLPVWTSVQEVIKKIQEEALQEGDSTKIDLPYLKKLYWTSVRVIGNGGSKGKKLPGDNEYLNISNYYKDISEDFISKEERRRLNQVYGLNPEYHGNSITGVLSGSTNSPLLPVWTSVQEAIKKIQEEALQKGDSTKIDLEYFREIYKKSVGDEKNTRSQKKQRAFPQRTIWHSGK